MKTDRLYAITVYLLNHGQTSASRLARHFEVSVRTIRRDMDALCLAGIPIVALNGRQGGYAVAERFRLDSHMASREEFADMLTALKGLQTATGNSRVGELYEKIANLSGDGGNGMVLDLSVLREGEEGLLESLRSAVREKRAVRFTYTNNGGETRIHTVEPIAVIYRWYAWYLLAFSRRKQDYRMYKLVRTEGMEVTAEGFTREHPSTEGILADQGRDREKRAKVTKVLLECAPEAVYRLKEYLNGRVLETCKNGTIRMELSVVEEELWWKGVLLSLADGVRILEPQRIREQVLDCARKTISYYQ